MANLAPAEPRQDKLEELSTDERWLADAGTVAHSPGGYMQRNVDVTEALRWLRSLRSVGVEAGFQHLLVYAAAQALARNPELHQIICGYAKHVPGTVDVAFSMLGGRMTRPVVLPGADQRPLERLVPALDEALVKAGEEAAKDRAKARRWSLLAPFGWLRRWVLRMARTGGWFRRRFAGTFQVSFAPSADLLVPLRVHAGSILGAGRVRDVVVSSSGRLEVRPMVSLALVIDHTALDGVRGCRLLNEIAAVLESGGSSGDAGGPLLS